MPRVTSAVPRKKRMKKILKAARGAFGSRSKQFHSAKETVIRAGNYARAGRRLKKREYRSLWIIRLSAACLVQDISYSRLINGLKQANILLNRKMLSELAISDPAAFSEVAQCAKSALARA